MGFRRLEHDGGTNIAGALAERRRTCTTPGRAGSSLFLTDGMARRDETNPERIADQAERGRGPFRVFAFGIGYDVNTYLLDRLTSGPGVSRRYIRPGGDIEQTVASLASKMASPPDDPDIAGDGVDYTTYSRRVCQICSGRRAGGIRALSGEERGERSVTVTGDGAGMKSASRRPRGSAASSRAPTTSTTVGRAQGGALSSDIRLHGPNPEIVERAEAGSPYATAF